MMLLDFHVHILPHMDHGSASVSTASRQLQLIKAAGVDEVCATSHFYPQSTLPDHFLSEREKSLALLEEAYGDAPRPQLILGAEVLICPALEKMQGLDRLCIEGTRVLLLEMPFTNHGWTSDLYKTIRNIRMMDITPVLAHVDRYPADLIEELLEDGMIGQINADSLDRWIKPKHLLRWIDREWIVALGSDLHGADPSEYHSFEKFVHADPARTEAIMARTHALLAQAVRH